VKVLVCCVPQAGHVNPMLPLLEAFVEAGDTVVVATGADVRSAIEATGASWREAGASLPTWFERLSARIRGNPGDGLGPERISHYFVPRLFGEIIADDMVDAALAVGRDFRPDLVMHDGYTFAGPLVAELLGVASAQHLFGPLTEPDILQLATDAVSPLWRSFGRDVPPYAGVYRGATVAICPPSLDHAVAPMGEHLASRPAPPPAKDKQAQAPPLVYLTLGTLWADPALLRTVLDALADEPVQVIVTTGQLEPSALGTLPANAQAERYIPQQDLLPRCSAIVHHAGAGTMFGALAHCVPQLALPQAADNFINAELLERAGAAKVLLPAEVGVEPVRAAVREVLTDPAIAERGAAIAGEIARMPPPAEVAQRLRALI
jgi:UDP:flavonoid glycosyltransferase YjiC (YdhE family)